MGQYRASCALLTDGPSFEVQLRRSGDMVCGVLRSISPEERRGVYRKPRVPGTYSVTGHFEWRPSIPQRLFFGIWRHVLSQYVSFRLTSELVLEMKPKFRTMTHFVLEAGSKGALLPTAQGPNQNVPLTGHLLLDKMVVPLFSCKKPSNSKYDIFLDFNQ